MPSKDFRLTGQISRYPKKNAGFGFIKPTGEFKDLDPIFFHRTEIEEGAILEEGDNVTFALGNSPKNAKPDSDVALDIKKVK